MKTQKWMLVASIILFLGAAALVAFTILTPYAWAQGPMGWDGGGPMFERGFGRGAGMGLGRGMMFDGEFGPRFGMGPGGRWGGPENAVLPIVAEELGMTPDELLAELQAGKTIADVAAEKNVAIDTIVDAVLAPRTERLNEMVAAGRLTQEQADTMLAQMRTQVTERLNDQWSPQGRGFGFGGNGPCGQAGMGMLGGRGGGLGNLVTVAAEELGLTRAELAAELQAGKSIADVAAEKNVSVDTIVDAVLAPRTEQLNELVAAGQLTQEQVDNRLADLQIDVIEWLNQSRASQNAAPAAEPGESESN